MIIVTGAAGFIGSNLVADLNAQGVTDIVLVDDLGSEGKWQNIVKRRFLDIVPTGEMESFLSNLSSAETVFHLGANSSTTATDGDQILATNFRSSKVLWEWCTRTRTPLIYASSAATYGDGGAGFSDDQSAVHLDMLRPLNLYGWSKHAFDKWAVAQSEVGLAPPHWCGVKLFNVYGPNEYHKGDMRSLVAKNFSPIAENHSIKLFKSYRPQYGDGQQLRDFIYVKDCTRVMLWLENQREINGLFNLGTGKARSFIDLAQAVGAALQTTVTIEFIDMPEVIRQNYQYFTEAEMDKIRSVGYSQPFYSLEAGVADYVMEYLMREDPYR